MVPPQYELMAREPSSSPFSMEIHAGKLLHEALEGIGNGGGHAAMGGGLIGKERLPELGNYPDNYIRNLFLDILAK